MATTLEIIAGDITTLPVEAIVNAANDALAPGGGVCGAIHRAAGPELAAACAALGGCATGSAKATPGFRLPARLVIHAVGPVWHGGEHGEADLLAGCYRSALDLAEDEGARSIAFPAISTGIYGYPLEQATAVAVATVRDWLGEHGESGRGGLDRVVFSVFGHEVEAAYRAALGVT